MACGKARWKIWRFFFKDAESVVTFIFVYEWSKFFGKIVFFSQIFFFVTELSFWISISEQKIFHTHSKIYYVVVISSRKNLKLRIFEKRCYGGSRLFLCVFFTPGDKIFLHQVYIIEI